MKLILSESQYNRIFNNKKKKIVVTESQYDRLLNESDLSNSFDKIKKFDIIKIDMPSGDLHFRVMSMTSNGLIMINCNNGVHKNAYFYINKSGYSGNSLKYKIAQDKRVEGKKDLWSTLGDTKIWRSSTFKNITNIDVYVDGKKDCNLSDNAKKKLSVVGDDSKDNSKDDSKSKMNINPISSVISTLNQIKSGYKYNITIGVYKENSKKDKGGRIANNIKDGNVIIHVISRAGKTVDFEVLSVNGESGNTYKHLIGKDSTFVIDKKSITIDDESKAVFKMFTLDIETFTDESDDGVRGKEDDAISNIMQFVVIGPYDKDKDGKDVEDDEEVGLSKDEIKKAVEEDDILRKMIQNNPGDAFVFLGLSRKKGIIPSQEIFSKWGAQPGNKSDFSNFKPGNIIKFEFIGKPELNKDEDKALLGEFINRVKDLDDKLIAKVGRYDGDEYLKLKCKKLSDINYELRLYKKEATGESTFEVVIVLLSEKSANNKKLAKSEIKVLDYDV